MRQDLLPFLQCIHCHNGELQLTPLVDRADQVEEGVLSCSGCGTVFPIVAGIPRLAETSAGEFDWFLREHGYDSPQPRQADSTATSRKTRAGFNEQLQSAFQVPTQSLKDDFSGRDHKNFFFATETNATTARALFENRVFLDVGAGGGQYSYDALSFGATVISLDMNDIGLATYHEAFRDCPRQHAIQASALKLPLKTECVDYAWSMGVLHHTDDLLLGFQEMARALKVGGIQNVGVYYQYKCWPYYAYLRKVTTHMPFFALWPLCHLLACLSYFPQLSFLAHPWVEKTERYRSRVTGCFDHLHPPIQGYYTPQEVASWYDALGCFADAHMTPVWNNFVGRKVSALSKSFSDNARASLMRC
jgi:SAM-dependent methyltransferase/uncharacterized protein YbaR (Trm112 family)